MFIILIVKAVCYLNSYKNDFDGGLFHFQDGEPKTVVPLGGVSQITKWTFTVSCPLFLLELKFQDPFKV